MSEYTKKERQQALKKIITGLEIGDQNRLLEELKQQGFEATQATISRDFQEMGIIKTRMRPGVYKYEIGDTLSEDVLWNKLQVLFDNFVTDIRSTRNMILVKTSPGNANGVASFIDRLNLSEVLGTVAGDDTILVIVDTDENRSLVEGKFHTLLRDSAEDE